LTPTTENLNAEKKSEKLFTLSKKELIDLSQIIFENMYYKYNYENWFTTLGFIKEIQKNVETEIF